MDGAKRVEFYSYLVSDYPFSPPINMVPGTRLGLKPIKNQVLNMVPGTKLDLARNLNCLRP